MKRADSKECCPLSLKKSLVKRLKMVSCLKPSPLDKLLHIRTLFNKKSPRIAGALPQSSLGGLSDDVAAQSYIGHCSHYLVVALKKLYYGQASRSISKS